MASFTYRGVHVELLPAGHGHYKATAYYANGSTVSVIIHDMDMIDRLKFPWDYSKKEVQEAKSDIYSHIVEKRKIDNYFL